MGHSEVIVWLVVYICSDPHQSRKETIPDEKIEVEKVEQVKEEDSLVGAELSDSRVDVAEEEGGVDREEREGGDCDGEGESGSEDELTVAAATKYQEFLRTCGDLLDPGEWVGVDWVWWKLL